MTENENAVQIKANANGPFTVLGPITFINEAGEIVDLPNKMRVSLCRCGRSANSPFCDGTHKTPIENTETV